MPRLNSANNAQSTLNVNITSADTTFTIVDSTAFPDAPFRLSIDAEIMEVTTIDKTTHTLTVERGKEGSVASSHNSGVNVENRWTAGAHEELADATIRQDSSQEFRVEVRTTDPTTPAVGRMWLRSDL
jgi:hypothetical protein